MTGKTAPENASSWMLHVFVPPGYQGERRGMGTGVERMRQVVGEEGWTL